MMSKLITHKVYALMLLVMTLLVTPLLSVATAQASSHAGLQKVANCQTPVLAGWRPYRVQAGESLSTLAAQAQVSVAELMKVNCLQEETITADTLLLAPAAGTRKISGVLAAPVPSTDAALTSNGLLTVISTTTTLAANGATATSAGSTSHSQLPALPWGWLTLVAFGVVGLATVFVGRRPLQPGTTLPSGRFGLWSNLLFLGIGIFMGMVVFPELRMPALTALPSGVSTGVTVALIGLLAAKELFFKGQQWRAVNRLLNVGLVPLLALFFLTVATRVAETIN